MKTPVYLLKRLWRLPKRREAPIIYHYDLIKEQYHHPDIGNYTSYGLLITWKGEHPDVYYQKISDISCKMCTVWKMADKFNQINLPAIHARDVVENLL